MTLLLVEDRDDDIIITLHDLDSLTNDIVVMRSCEAALDYLRKAQQLPMLILLDLNFGIGYMDGATMLLQMQRDERLKSVPVVVLTVSQDDSERLIAMGAKDYMTKPIKPETLVAILKRLGIKWSIGD